jgi:hypothetical protein
MLFTDQHWRRRLATNCSELICDSSAECEGHSVRLIHSLRISRTCIKELYAYGRCPKQQGESFSTSLHVTHGHVDATLTALGKPAYQP